MSSEVESSTIDGVALNARQGRRVVEVDAMADEAAEPMVRLESLDMRQHLRGPGEYPTAAAIVASRLSRSEFESAAHEATIQEHCV